MTHRIVFLPGASGEGSFWQPVATLLRDHESTMLDWPGFGPVPPDAGVTSYDDLASMVIDRLERPSVLVAQSMGGVVATMAAARRPDQPARRGGAPGPADPERSLGVVSHRRSLGRS